MLLTKFSWGLNVHWSGEASCRSIVYDGLYELRPLFPFLLYELTDQGNKIFSVLFLFIFTNPVDVTEGFDCRGT